MWWPCIANAPQDIPLNIIHEDEALLVINKPAGLVVHPAPGNPDRTLVNALLHYCPALAELPRAGIIHRIDKDTTGLMVVAKTLTAHTQLVQQLQAREIKREYLALVKGEMISGSSIDQPIGRHPSQRTKMAVVGKGKPAITHYRIKQRFGHYTLLHVQLETGRTHQIRVHLAYIHHPIVGDPTYGGRLQFPKDISEDLQQTLTHFKRQALHAWRLTLDHPVSKQQLSFQAEPPADFVKLIDQLPRQN